MKLPSVDDFLNIFSYYLCPRCTHCAGEETPQHIEPGSGKHAHNGEILRFLEPVVPNSARLLSAYHAYVQANRRVHLQQPIAIAYNTPTPLQPWDSETLAMCRLIDYRHSVWIRHGVENPQVVTYNTAQDPFPPSNSRHIVGSAVTLQNQHLNHYAVDTDVFPFVVCSRHGENTQWQNPWDKTAAYLPLELYTGKFVHPPDRDHYYATQQIPVHLWIHTYTDNLDERLTNLGVPTLHTNTVKKLHTVLTHLDIHQTVRPRTSL